MCHECGRKLRGSKWTQYIIYATNVPRMSHKAWWLKMDKSQEPPVLILDPGNTRVIGKFQIWLSGEYYDWKDRDPEDLCSLRIVTPRAMLLDRDPVNLNSRVHPFCQNQLTSYFLTYVIHPWISGNQHQELVAANVDPQGSSLAQNGHRKVRQTDGYSFSIFNIIYVKQNLLCIYFLLC